MAGALLSAAVEGREALLCERCGYELDALPPEGECPECGRSIGLSQPVRRQGSPWQERPGLLSWVTTGAMTVTRPVDVFASVRIDGASARGLFWVNCLVAAVLMTVTLALPLLSSGGGRAWNLVGPEFSPLVFLALALGVCVSGVLLLTWIETLGVRHFGRRRGWRVTAEVAWTVAAHAAVGWVIGGVLMLAGMAGLVFYEWATAIPPEVYGGRRVLIVRASPAPEWALWMMAAAFLAGMLAFEVLVYVGIRRCRYANPPGKRVCGDGALAA